MSDSNQKQKKDRPDRAHRIARSELFAMMREEVPQFDTAAFRTRLGQVIVAGTNAPTKHGSNHTRGR